MKFGHIENIGAIDFTLPADHAVTGKVLNGKPVKKPRIFAGLPVWAEKGLPAKIYPKGTRSKDFLKFYALQFNSIELNATAYGIPTIEDVESWVAVVPKGFVFCPKVSLAISQVKPLGKNRQALKGFNDAMHAFGHNLGAIFLQLHPQFSPKRYDDLVHFLDHWDDALPLHVELRHLDWFSNPDQLANFFEELRKRKIGTVLTDTAGRRDAIHQCLTTKSAFIRFDGNDLYKTDFERIDAWTHVLKRWLDNGLQTIYFFPHSTTKSLTPEMSNYFLEQMGAISRLELKLATVANSRS